MQTFPLSSEKMTPKTQFLWVWVFKKQKSASSSTMSKNIFVIFLSQKFQVFYFSLKPSSFNHIWTEIKLFPPYSLNFLLDQMFEHI